MVRGTSETEVSDSAMSSQKKGQRRAHNILRLPYQKKWLNTKAYASELNLGPSFPQNRSKFQENKHNFETYSIWNNLQRTGFWISIRLSPSLLRFDSRVNNQGTIRQLFVSHLLFNSVHVTFRGLKMQYGQLISLQKTSHLILLLCYRIQVSRKPILIFSISQFNSE